MKLSSLLISSLLFILSFSLWAQTKPTVLFSDDPRVTKNFTYSSVIVPISELGAVIAKNLGVTITITHDIADLKAAVFVKDIPSNEIMSSLAKALDLSWERNGEQGKWTYRLYQTQKQKEKIAKLKDYVEESSLKKAKKELDKCEQLASKPFADVIKEQMAAVKDMVEVQSSMEKLYSDPAVMAAMQTVEKEAQAHPMDDEEDPYNQKWMFERLNQLAPNPLWGKLSKMLDSSILTSYGSIDLGHYIAGFISKQMNKDQKAAFWSGTPMRASIKGGDDGMKLPSNLEDMQKLQEESQKKIRESYSQGMDTPPPPEGEQAPDVKPDYANLTITLKYDAEKGITLLCSDYFPQLDSFMGGGTDNTYQISSAKLKLMGLDELVPQLMSALPKDDFYKTKLTKPEGYKTSKSNYGDGYGTLLGDMLREASVYSSYSFIAETNRTNLYFNQEMPATLGELLQQTIIFQLMTPSIEHTDKLAAFHTSWRLLLQRSKEVPERSIRVLEAQEEKLKGVDLNDWVNFVSSLSPEQSAALDPQKLVIKVSTYSALDAQKTPTLRLLASLTADQRQTLQTSDIPFMSLNPAQKRLYYLIMREGYSDIFRKAETDPKIYQKFGLRLVPDIQDRYVVTNPNKKDDDGQPVENEFTTSTDLQKWMKDQKTTTGLETKYIRNSTYEVQIGELQPRDAKKAVVLAPGSGPVTEATKIDEEMQPAADEGFMRINFYFTRILPMPSNSDKTKTKVKVKS